jgi:hypothetical protein
MNIQTSSAQTTIPQVWSLMGQAELPPSVMFGETEMDLWPYRRRTVALLRRYARASVEVGRLPSLLGREFFRTRVTSYTMRNFEDVVIFVTDMEQAIEKLTAIEKKILAMNVLEEYSTDEVARLLGCTPRNVRRLLQDALDRLSRILLAGGLMEELPSPTRGVSKNVMPSFLVVLIVAFILAAMPAHAVGRRGGEGINGFFNFVAARMSVQCKLNPPRCLEVVRCSEYDRDHADGKANKVRIRVPFGGGWIAISN